VNSSGELSEAVDQFHFDDVEAEPAKGPQVPARNGVRPVRAAG